jgi:cellulose synthase/poly-beta-1,6-N-acetylglucosamine synthase-like glycosyltransferase
MTISSKRPHLWLMSLLIWAIELAYGLGPSVPLLFRHDLRPIEKIALLTCYAWLGFAWLCSSYYVLLTVLSVWAYPKTVALLMTEQDYPPVALLYVTCNDFVAGAFLSCVEQNYPNYHVYILDDSDDAQIIQEIDCVLERFNRHATVVRRPHRIGFKAGNLNSALRQLCQEFQYFAVCDADSSIPEDFLTVTISRILIDDRIGFVQAAQKVICKSGDTQFVKDLAPAVEIYWRMLKATDEFGFTMFHGHGAIVRMKAWEAIGGFPEVVAEDLAFSTRLLEHGYRGVLDYNAFCEEMFPSDYKRFCRRQLKYVMGTAEHARLFLWPFLTSSNVSLVEKVDRLLATAVMISPVGLMLFFAASLALGPTVRLRLASHLGITVLSLFTLLAPILPAVLYRWQTVHSFVRHLFASIAVHLSMIVISAAATVCALRSRVQTFPITGERGFERTSSAQEQIMALIFATVLGGIGLFLLGCGLTGALPVCVATAFGVVAKTVSWEHGIVRVLLAFPAVVLVALVATLSIWAVSGSGLLAQVPTFVVR